MTIFTPGLSEAKLWDESNYVVRNQLNAVADPITEPFLPTRRAASRQSMPPPEPISAIDAPGVTFDLTQVDTVPGQPALTSSPTFSTPHVFAAGARLQVEEQHAAGAR